MDWALETIFKKENVLTLECCSSMVEYCNKND